MVGRVYSPMLYWKHDMSVDKFREMPTSRELDYCFWFALMKYRNVDTLGSGGELYIALSAVMCVFVIYL